MSASNLPSDFSQDVPAIRVPERDTIIPSFYNARDHSNLEAIVTENGMPIAVNGEVLTIGMIPPERRWAVGPVDGTSAEILPRERFEPAFRHYFEEDLRSKGGRPTFPDLWPVPTASNFVSWKVMPHDPSRLTPLGIPFTRETPRPSATKYDPRLDRIIDALSDRVQATPEPVAAQTVSEEPAKKKRGYKMSDEAKAAASERSRKYWAERKARQAAEEANA